ncbi:MAG: bifunctional diaminohydroxyphosphoribosylaminopyrimidine deaminase/5-amino-6-(5-phosphoribosylamino)uracil reductase RibD [Bdellovibrionota bacterium]
MDEKIVSVASAMKMAIIEARKGAPFVSPNPVVGCVILDSSGKLLSQGHHEKYGGPHAEISALKNLNPEQLKGAHVVVTLEPCAHEGRTGSCAMALAKLPISKVTYGIVDPNPLVSGKGAAILNQAGIETKSFADSLNNPNSDDQKLLEDLEELCEIFLTNFRHQRIFVSLKVATSLDGAIALKSGDSQWITGKESRSHGHYLRGTHDLTLVGVETVLKDNPTLNVRDQSFTKENKVGILDSKGRTLNEVKTLNIFKTHKPENIYVFVKSNFKSAGNSDSPIQLVEVKSQDEKLVWKDLFQQLWAKGVRSVLIEGGARTASSVLKAGMVDRLHLFQAPTLLGQKGSKLWNQDLELTSMKNKLDLYPIKITQLGSDLYITGRLKRD